MDNLTDKQFYKLNNEWIEQNKCNVTLCDPRGKPGSLAFYLQFETLADYLKAHTYFENKNVYLLQCTAHANRLQVYQWQPTRTRQ